MAMDFRLGPGFVFFLNIFAVFKIAWSQSLEFDTILPDNPQEYDNLQPPRHKGEATVVRFHVTVLSLDTIDEGSMDSKRTKSHIFIVKNMTKSLDSALLQANRILPSEKEL
ncbi:uncharacterized protein TNCT_603211 [Trichonephila clavata]|uniref:Uncharacterized protein n=1 Tax=Trichonephila clavata TaxID=2740835 RepID=A0A8X6KFZ6_TRICU|nr:uncharacterized protein TNCT_603211 [Trichonephila clavata]